MLLISYKNSFTYTFHSKCTTFSIFSSFFISSKCRLDRIIFATDRAPNNSSTSLTLQNLSLSCTCIIKALHSISLLKNNRVLIAMSICLKFNRLWLWISCEGFKSLWMLINGRKDLLYHHRTIWWRDMWAVISMPSFWRVSLKSWWPTRIYFFSRLIQSSHSLTRFNRTLWFISKLAWRNILFTSIYRLLFIDI
jgi:hypothetical protein